MDHTLLPEKSVFRAHLVGGRFRSGSAADRWRFVSVSWPHAVFGVWAADGIEYGLRFECEGYPPRRRRRVRGTSSWTPAGLRQVADGA